MAYPFEIYAQEECNDRGREEGGWRENTILSAWAESLWKLETWEKLWTSEMAWAAGNVTSITSLGGEGRAAISSKPPHCKVLAIMGWGGGGVSQALPPVTFTTACATTDKEIECSD